MFERLKIEIWGHQPTAKITSRTLDKIIQRDYDDNYKEVWNYSLNGRNRLNRKLHHVALDTLRSPVRRYIWPTENIQIRQLFPASNAIASA
jgi:hypothetical protein